MISVMKNNIVRLSVAVLGLGLAFAVGASSANAQVSPTTCPSATSYYSNGYSINTCVPSYYPSYPQTTVYLGQSPYSINGNYYPGAGFSTTQTNPFQPAVVNNNALNLFAPTPTYTAPTYYYPQVYTTGYTYTTYPSGPGGYSNGFYNNGGYNNGYYGGGYNNGGFGNGYYYGNNGWH
jgi:hypothetical protein